MKLILCDRNLSLCHEWEKLFNNIENVSIVNDSFINISDYDCIVSPANSFGIMDGGFDGALTTYFGNILMENVQKNIKEEYAGEQPVGTSIIVETGNKRHPYCAHTPTMRVPKIIDSYDTVYNAMRAMIIAVSKHNNIKTVLCPGLCTATGRVPFTIAASQMFLAYQSIINPPQEITWLTAVEIERRLL